jgi:hypothetical protein
LEYAILHDGQIMRRSTLAFHGENDGGEVPVYGRFHDAGGDRLYVVGVFHEASGASPAIVNRMARIQAGGTCDGWVDLKLDHPFTHPFFTATPRAGNQPSGVMDLLGSGAGRPSTIRYARVRVAGV